MIFMNETNLSLKYLIDQLHKEQTLTKEEWITLIEGHTPELSEYLFSLAREERHRYYGHDIYVRGLIEFTNIVKTTVCTAVYGKATATHTGTACQKPIS